MRFWKRAAVFFVALMIVANLAFAKTSQQDGLAFLSKPGFRAILGSMQDQSFIYIESRKDGLIFRDCEVGVSDDVIAGEALPTQCPTMLNNDSIAIPPALLLKDTLGLGRILTTGLKVLAAGGMIVVQNMSWGVATEGAAMANAVIPASPIDEIRNLKHAQKVIKTMLKYGEQSQQLKDGQIVTELSMDSYDDIKAGVLSELIDCVKKMMKKDKSLDYRWKQAYHTLINERYAALWKKEQDQQRSDTTGQAPN